MILVFLVIGGGVLAAAVDQTSKKTYSWRYKMTVEIETPDGLKTGSAVREVAILFTPTGNTSPKDRKYNSHISMKGEAVVIDLGERGKVFAVQSLDHSSLPFYLFDGPPGRTIGGAEFYSDLKGKVELPVKSYPKFVKFKDVNNPLSVQLVYGLKANKHGGSPSYSFQNNFKKLYGKGFRLKRILIEMTEEPVTYKIEKILPWIKNYRNKHFDGRNIQTIEAENRLANRLGMGAFTTGKEE